MSELSVIIVNWNTISLLHQVLRSAYDTCGAIRMQMIVIDNASEDGSADMVAREFPEALLIRNLTNRGFAAANNQGFEVATGRYVLMLNSDTIVLGDVLAASVRYLNSHPDVGAMGCRVLNPDRTMQRTCSMWPSLINLVLQTSGLCKLSWPRFLGRYQMMGWQRDSERDVDSITGCYLMLCNTVLKQVGPLDEAFFFFGEETDWCRRIRLAGWRLAFAPVGEIIHYGSASASKLNYRRDLLLTDAMVRLHAKHGGRLAAVSAWMILFLFNFSRASFWTITSLVQRRTAASDRARHFRQVVAGQLGFVKLEV